MPAICFCFQPSPLRLEMTASLMSAGQRAKKAFRDLQVAATAQASFLLQPMSILSRMMLRTSSGRVQRVATSPEVPAGVADALLALQTCHIHSPFSDPVLMERSFATHCMISLCLGRSLQEDAKNLGGPHLVAGMLSSSVMSVSLNDLGSCEEGTERWQITKF